MSVSSPSAAAIFCFCSISSTVRRRSRSAAASSKRILRGGLVHARAKLIGQIPVPAFEEQPHVADRLGVCSRSTSPSTHGPRQRWMWYSQARVRVLAAEIDRARRHFEVAVDEMHQAVRQIAGEIRAVIGGAVLFQSPGDVNARDTSRP